MTLRVRQLLVWCAALGTIALTVSAGVWQMGRAEAKRQAQAALAQQRQMPAWTAADWPCQADPAALPVQRPVLLRGHWLAAHTVFLENRPMAGASGFIVVTPLRLSPGNTACPGGIVLVQRGWVPRDPAQRLRLPDVFTPAQEVQVSGRILPGLSRVYQLGAEAPAGRAAAPLVRQNADAAFWSDWLGVPPLAGAVLQEQAATPQDAPVLQRAWPEVGQGQDKHLAYAAQWFAMAAVVAGLTIWFQLIRPRRQRHPSTH